MDGLLKDDGRWENEEDGWRVSEEDGGWRNVKVESVFPGSILIHAEASSGKHVVTLEMSRK